MTLIKWIGTILQIIKDGQQNYLKNHWYLIATESELVIMTYGGTELLRIPAKNALANISGSSKVKQ